MRFRPGGCRWTLSRINDAVGDWAQHWAPAGIVTYERLLAPNGLPSDK
jgi:hypothetical protein